MLLQILNYNNYYNRIVKYLDTYEEYAPYVVYNLNGANFNPNDNVNTTHVFGDSLNSYNGMGDYLIVVGVNNNIESRWFIIESKRNRGGQWTLELRRDLLADYKYRYEQMPAFIEKAYVDNPYDPAIFNKENMSFNQIKTEETLLKDPTGVKWVVGYCAKDFHTENQEMPNPELTELNVITDTDVVNELETYSLGSEKYLYTNPKNERIRYILKHNPPGGSTKYYESYISVDNQIMDRTEDYDDISSDYYNFIYRAATIIDLHNWLDVYLQEFFPIYKGDLRDYIMAAYNINYVGNNEIVNNYKNKYITKTVDGITKIFRINIISTGVKSLASNIPANTSGWDEYTNVAEAIKEYGRIGVDKVSLNEPKYASTKVDFNSYQIQFLDETDLFEQGILRYSIPATRQKTIDSVYDIFAIPYSEEALAIKNNNDVYIANANLSVSIAQSIATEFIIGASGKIYDLQLLPYCPLQSIIDLNIDTEDGILDISGLVESKDFSYIKTNDNPEIIKNIIFFAPQIKTNFSIYKSITITDLKESNECDVYRLTSGDYSSSFEFSPAKNGGVDYFECDCTFKPYSPYIHLAPNFKGLYGRDYNDPRGLICGGDFSLSTVTDPFNTYKLQNKNFQLAFDRQIENMEVQHDVQRVQDIIGGIFGGIQTAGVGAGIGAVIGGATASIPGAIVGGIAGAGLGGAAGGTDYFLNERLRNEAIDFSKDMFGYQLGNIKALPNTLNKVDSFTNNNKVFPVLEYFTCTAQERQAFRDKIRYNGMSIGRIGTIAEWVKYFETYIKARLIRITDLNEDLHVANELANEINKGFFIGGSNG